MAERIFKKITLTFVPVLLLAASACAKEEFVKYSEVRDSLAPAVQSVVPEAGSINADELRTKIQQPDKPLLFDARGKTEFDKEHLPQARLPRPTDFYQDVLLYQQKVIREAPSSRTALERGTKDLPRDTEIVTYCNKHCGLSKTLKFDLEQAGFTNVKWLDGGIDVWREKGYPFEVRVTDNPKVAGAILSDQVKSLDWRARRARRLARVPDADLAEVRGKLKALIGAV